MTHDEFEKEFPDQRYAKWGPRVRFVVLTIMASIPLAVVLAIGASIIVTKQVCGL